MSTERMREQLRKFYSDSFAKMLKIRKAKKNIILYKQAGEERTVIARFDMGFADASGVENTCSLAMRMADACKDAVLGHLVDVEMDKLDDKVADAEHRAHDQVDAMKYAVQPTALVNTVPPVEPTRFDPTPITPLPEPKPAKDTLESFLGQ